MINVLEEEDVIFGKDVSVKLLTSETSVNKLQKLLVPNLIILVTDKEHVMNMMDVNANKALKEMSVKFQSINVIIAKLHAIY